MDTEHNGDKNATEGESVHIGQQHTHVANEPKPNSMTNLNENDGNYQGNTGESQDEPGTTPCQELHENLEPNSTTVDNESVDYGGPDSDSGDDIDIKFQQDELELEFQRNNLSNQNSSKINNLNINRDSTSKANITSSSSSTHGMAGDCRHR